MCHGSKTNSDMLSSSRTTTPSWIHCTAVVSVILYFYSLTIAQGSLWCAECYDGRWPFSLKHFGLGFVENGGFRDCASTSMDGLPALTCL